MEAFELRLWDGRLGRWLTVDPHHEFDSPYLGMGNSPIGKIDPDGGSTEEAYPPFAGSENGQKWMDSDGSWCWNGKTGIWEGQGKTVDFVPVSIHVTNVAPPMIKQYEANFFGKVENILNFKNLDYFPNKTFGAFAILMGKYQYSILDNAYVYGTRNYYKNPEMARHLNGFGASKNKVVEAGISTIQTIMPSPIKGKFAGSGAKSTLLPKFNVATFGKTFKGTFATRLSASNRGWLIRTINARVISQTSRSRLLSNVKLVGKKVDKYIINPEEE